MNTDLSIERERGNQQLQVNEDILQRNELVVFLPVLFSSCFLKEPSSVMNYRFVSLLYLIQKAALNS